MKRLLTIVLATLAALLASVLLALAAVVMVAWSPLATPVARFVLGKTLPGIRVERLSLDGFLTLTLHDARAIDEDGQLCARIGRAELRLHPAALLDGRVHIAAGELRDVEIDIRDTTSGWTCIVTSLPASLVTGPTRVPRSMLPVAIHADDLSLVNGLVRIYSNPLSAAPVVFEIAALRLAGGFNDPVAYADIQTLDAIMWLVSRPVRLAIEGHATVMVPYALGDAALSLRAETEGLVFEGRLAARLHDASLAVNLDAVAEPWGAFGVIGHLDFLPTFFVEATIGAPNLDLGPLGVDAQAVLGGEVRMVGIPLSPGAFTDVTVDLRGSRFEKRALDEASLAVHVTNDGWTLTRGRVRALGVSVTATAEGDLDRLHANANATFSGKVPLLRLDASVGRLAVEVSADINAASQKLSANVLLEELHVEELPRVGSLKASRATASLSAEGGGRLALWSATLETSGVAFSAAADVLTSLRLSVGRTGTALEAHIAANVTSGDEAGGTLTLRGDAEARVADARVWIPPAAQVLSSLRGAVTLEAKRLLPRQSSSLSARVVVGLDETLGVEGALFSSATTGFPREIAHLSAETSRSILEAPFGVDAQQAWRLRLVSRAVRLAALNGLVPGLPVLEGSLTADVSVEGTVAESKVVARIDVRDAKLRGVSAGRLTLGGRATLVAIHQPAHRQLNGDLRFEAADLEYGSLRAGGVQLDASVAHHKIDLGMKGHWPNGKEWLTASGALDHLWDGAPTTLTAKASMRDFDVGLLRVFLPDLQLKGRLRLDARAEGPWLSPDLSGELSLSDGTVAYAPFPRVEAISLHGTFDRERILIDRLTGQGAGGRGTLSAKGELSLDAWSPRKATASLSLNRYAFDFGVVRNAQLTSRIDADLSFAEGVTGAVSLDSGSLEVGEIGDGDRKVASTSGVTDVHFVEFDAEGGLSTQHAAARVREKRTTLDITLRARELLIRSDKSSLGMTADLRLRDAEDGVAPSGWVQVTQGRVDLLDRLYDVERARVTFSGHSDLNPALDLRVARAFPRARVIIEVRGTARKPVLALSSVPPIYDRSQLLALVLTGREEVVSDVNASTSASDRGTTERVAGSVASALLGPLASSLGKAVGIDIVRVGIEGSAEEARRASVLGEVRASLEVGKFITDRLYIGARGVLGTDDAENAYEARLEYGLTERLRLESAFGNRGVGELDLMWRYAY